MKLGRGLRWKTAIILFGASTVTLTVFYVASRFLLLQGFVRVEEEIVQNDVRRALGALERQIEALRDRTVDWAYWDDTYTFAESKDDKYIEENLTDEQMSSYLSALNYVLFFNKNHELTFCKGFDQQNKVERVLPADLLAQLKKDSPLVAHPKDDSVLSGLLMLDEGPIAIASCPILKTDISGPMNGTLIFASQFDQAKIDDLSKTLRTTISVYRPGDPALPRDVRAILGHLDAPGRIAVQFLDADRVAAYTLLSDVLGKPILVLRSDRIRDVFHQGLRSLRYFGLCTLVAGVIQGVLILLLMGRIVLNPVARLTSGLRRVEVTSDLSLRMPMVGKDELADLGGGINRMLEALQMAQDAVRFNEARLRGIVENAVDAVITSDERGTIQSVNKAAEQIFGYKETELIGRNVSILMPEPYRSQHAGYMEAYLRTGERRLLGMGRDLLAQKKDGTVFSAYVALSEVCVADQRVFTGLIRDVTERKRYEEYLTHAATHDPLTGLVNRRVFGEQIDVAINSSKRHGHALCLCMMDVDHFKEVNDRYGHGAGDDVLQWLGEAIRQDIRREDIGARFGGDEFCICFTHTSSLEAYHSLERLRNSLEAHIFRQDSDHPFVVTLSIGLADLLTQDTDSKALLDAADRSLYLAKERGRNRIVTNEQ